MSNLQVFKYNTAEVRTVIKDGEPWWVAKDVCDIFGETNRNRAMQSLDEDEKGYTQMTTPGGNQKLAIINESGLYSLLFAMQPAKARGVSDEYLNEREDKLRAFKRWVTHEVLPSIRKTGSYSAVSGAESKRIEILDRNARSRAASLYLRIANNDALPPNYRAVLLSYASKELAGEPILPLPKAERKTYSAADIGAMLGVSGQKIGRLANAHNLKTDEYGQLYHDKSRYSSKEVETFRYYDTTIPIFEGLLAK